MADGVYLTGAGSNIDPALYGQENQTPGKAGTKIATCSTFLW